ncbi:MAG: HmuY family protein [Leptospiraceae bacterium]|nr:HmuY family protein [Leptospiraceae bacterium]
MFSIKFFLLGAILPLLFSCAQKTQKDSMPALALLVLDGNDILKTTNENLDKVSTVNEGSQTFKTIVNATSTKQWVYFRFVDGKQVSSSSNDWDLRFKRFIIGSNSGTSGTGSAGVCNTNYTDFTIANNSIVCTSFTADTQQSQTGGGVGMGDVNETANPSLFGWYNYNNTILTSKGLVYVVRNSFGNAYYKLQILDYYSQAGTSGYITFRWAKID